MATAAPHDQPVDLDPLDSFLNSDAVPPGCMGLSDLDGFLAGLAAGPEPLQPSEWLPVVWGDGEPEFATPEQAEAILAIMMARQSEIRRQLETDPDSFEPVFWAGEDDEPIVSDWAAGFLEAVTLRPDAWDRLTEDPEAGGLFTAIVLLGSDPENLDVEGVDASKDDIEQLLEDGPELIPDAVIGIHAFWAEQRRKPGLNGARQGGKPPRGRPR